MPEPDLKGLTCNEIVRKIQPSETPLIAIYDGDEHVGYVPKSEFLSKGMFVTELPETKHEQEVTPFGTIWYRLDVVGLKEDRAKKLLNILRGLQARGVAGNFLPKSVAGNA